MKKVLLATTALAMTAGMAAADVSLSGYAEIGVKDNGAEVVFHHDFDVKFTLAGETDGGLAFGATIDLDEVSNGIDADANPSSVFVSGDFGTITMGDTDGAFDWAMTEIAWGTAIADDHSSHAGWSGNSGLDGALDGQVARYDNTFGDFGFALSAEIGDGTGDEVIGVGVKYSGDFGGTSVGIGIGYQDGDVSVPIPAGLTGVTGISASGDIAGASLALEFAGGFQARLNYSQVDATISATTTGTGTGAVTTAVSVDVDWDHTGVGVAYAGDGWIAEANYGQFDGTIAGVGDFEADGFGLAFNYDLGGGAVIMVGYGSGEGFALDGTNVDSVDTWSAGLGLSF
jgi:outer membrane protein OmpU